MLWPQVEFGGSHFLEIHSNTLIFLAENFEYKYIFIFYLLFPIVSQPFQKDLSNFLKKTSIVQLTLVVVRRYISHFFVDQTGT